RACQRAMSSLDIPQVSTLAGFYTLFYKEWLRFWKVSIQTVLAPVLTALLFLLVFGHTLRNSLEPYPGVAYSIFLVPGLAMLSILSGVFYSVHSLPPFWLGITHLNPFFYIVDGFRQGFFGVGDVTPWVSASIVALSLLGLSLLNLWLIRSGYKLRH